MVVTHGNDGDAAILGLETNRKRRLVVAICIPVRRNAIMKLDGDGGIFFMMHPRREKSFSFKPASVQSLWSALQSLSQVLEGAPMPR